MPSYLHNITVLHSLLRYFILLFAFIVAGQSLIGMMKNGKFKKMNKQAALSLLIFCDLQLVLGLLLYYYKIIGTGILNNSNMMKDPYSRFYAVEHSAGMTIAIILVHIGYSVTKRNMDDDHKFKRLFWCSFIALGIFMAMIPWEGKQVVGRPNIPHLGS